MNNHFIQFYDPIYDCTYGYLTCHYFRKKLFFVGYSIFVGKIEEVAIHVTLELLPLLLHSPLDAV